MDIKTVLTCPLGSKCEEVKDGAIHRCAWFIQMAGTDPTTGKEVDQRNCSMAWMPILLVENSGQQRKTGAAIESFRNEVVSTNQQIMARVLLTNTY
jgi:hypothetical protein